MLRTSVLLDLRFLYLRRIDLFFSNLPLPSIKFRDSHVLSHFHRFKTRLSHVARQSDRRGRGRGKGRFNSNHYSITPSLHYSLLPASSSTHTPQLPRSPSCY